MVERPELKVTVFSDYICPFCYRATQDYRRRANGTPARSRTRTRR